MEDALDGLAELQRLRREADDLNRRLAVGHQRAAGSSAWDPAQAVRVVLDQSGRIEAVEVAPEWARRVGADRLGTAVVAAADAATQRWSEAWAGGIDEADQTDTAPRDAPAPQQPAGRLSPDYARGLFYVLKDSFAQLDQLAAEAERNAREGRTTADEQGHVTVTVEGQRLSAVRLDEAWLTSTGAQQLGEQITAAVKTAFHDDRSLRASWPFSELDRMTADPAALFANLGLAGRDPRGER
ncbi:hypothetical protein DFJ67_5107 [Asanoa ferruginea]|uniref:YbaB/EbfC DNA-binding family protein n=1 Tax=Asanoa ferruginea TaxID=53367 RepID=A0A3D9ZP89_9ACTN|nr:hypothetical protein [Asanoa ferruginea]REF99081.1 hypothetical protein DFJ67_5107 [Asanoa ferruginea]GIF51355.1 hypothetical protein Afe04nite_58940 [Asanoa ferruginea]